MVKELRGFCKPAQTVMPANVNSSTGGSGMNGSVQIESWKRILSSWPALRLFSKSIFSQTTSLVFLSDPCYAGTVRRQLQAANCTCCSILLLFELATIEASYTAQHHRHLLTATLTRH